MKKFLLICMCLVLILCAVACNDNGYVSDMIGETGEGGGYIFIDKGSYSNGWRYAEVAPVDVAEEAQFGVFRTSATLSTKSKVYYNYFANLMPTFNSPYNKTRRTLTGVGMSANNTANLIKLRGASLENSKMKVFTAEFTEGTTEVAKYTELTGKYAAEYLADFEYGGKTDWAMPSIEELKLISSNLDYNCLSSFNCDLYWSSSESHGDALQAYAYRLGSEEDPLCIVRTSKCGVLAVRYY